MLPAMFAHQRLSWDSCPNWCTFWPQRGLCCHLHLQGCSPTACFPSTPPCYRITLPMPTTQESSFLPSTLILKPALLLAELTSAVGCLPATSIWTSFFSEAFCRGRTAALSPAQTPKNLGVNSHSATATTSSSSTAFCVVQILVILCQYYFNSLLAGFPTDLSPASTTEAEGCSLSHFNPH